MSQENDDKTILTGKVLNIESARGYSDNATTCGLEEFIRLNLPGALAIVAEYARKDRFGRQQVVSLLFDFLAGADVTPPAKAGAFEDLLLQIRYAKGVGAKRVARLNKLGINTIEDLLTYLPRRLEDRSRFSQIGQLRYGQEVCVRGKVVAVDQRRINKRTTVVRATIEDGTGFLYPVWFNQPWIAEQLHRGAEIDVFGKVEQSYGQLRMNSPVWEKAGEKAETGRLVPIYPATEGVSDRFLRTLILRNLEAYGGAFREVIPDRVKGEYGLLSKDAAVRMLHFPTDPNEFERARRSLAFEEIFLLQLGMAQTSLTGQGRSHADSGKLVDSFLAHLPFSLTAAQQSVLREILADLRASLRMMRLLQGDVGSGKTIVALIAALAAIDAGYQAAFMVPTEILAEQHVSRLRRLLADLPVRIAVLTGTTKDKTAVKENLAAGEIDLLVGTHALIQEDVAFCALGLVIIDEQHRFGVVQRSLIEEKGEAVDILVMSATPIPRTIALTLYGEFDISLIKEMPLGEKAVHTVWLAENRRAEVYAEVERLLVAGSKGYVVLPLVEESEKLDLKAATQVAEELSAAFAASGVGLIHGRLPAREKSAAMEAFETGEIRLLVATTVIEVGIDVLDADLMIIEHAERFGLSQLHQLRGRIGRAGQKATCFAIATTKSEEATRRLTAFTTHLDGFKIAEEDFLIRGPGDLLGTKQHGFLSRLRAVDLIRDLDIIGAARQEARRIATESISPALADEVERRFGEVLKWLHV